MIKLILSINYINRELKRHFFLMNKRYQCEGLITVLRISYFQGTDLRVQGGGIIHAIHVDIQSTNLIVDDLGEIIGDYHELTCTSGNGVAGTTGSGKSNSFFTSFSIFHF